MKRPASRASRISTDGLDNSENSFLGIPEAKWQEFSQREETDLFILGLREEIIQRCLETCYDNYLERQAVSFTVYCSYLAWCKVLDMYYMFRDPGDRDDPVTMKTWEPDPEPEPSIIDTWGSQCMESASAPKPEGRTELSERADSKPEIPVICSTDSMESCSFMSNLFGEEEEGGFLQSLASSSLMSALSERKSIFTRTLSTPREDLPIIKPVDVLKDVCNFPQSKKKGGKKCRTPACRFLNRF